MNAEEPPQPAARWWYCGVCADRYVIYCTRCSGIGCDRCRDGLVACPECRGGKRPVPAPDWR